MKNRGTLILGVATILLASLFAGAGTFAYFSDVETSTGNKFTAGTLDLKVNDEDDPITLHMDLTDMKPGDDTGYYKWTLKNVGSITGVISIEFSPITNDDNGLTEPEEDAGDKSGGPVGGGELGAYLEYGMKLDTTTLGIGSNILNSLSRQTVGPFGSNWVLGPGGTVDFKFKLYLPIGTGNIVQSDSVEFDIIFHLDQLTP